MYLLRPTSGWSWLALGGLLLLGFGALCLRRPGRQVSGRVPTWTKLDLEAAGGRSVVGFHCNETQAAPPGGQCEVTILHISDTHGQHREMSQNFMMPFADILLHTGDITNWGTSHEIQDFNAWLGEHKHKYKHGLYLVTGNHDWMSALKKVASNQLAPEALLDSKFMQNQVPNARVLNHTLVEVAGLRIFGSDWCPWYGYAAPGDYWKMEWNTARSVVYDRWKHQVLETGGKVPVPTHRYEEIPEGVDILMTHMAPWDVFDHTLQGNWGGSKTLLQKIQAVKPKAHLFGHIHESRGGWQRCNSTEAFHGGSEYAPIPGKIFDPQLAPAQEYPSDLILNNAQMNNLWVDHRYTGEWHPPAITGPGKLITARWTKGRWQFSAQAVPSKDKAAALSVVVAK